MSGSGLGFTIAAIGIGAIIAAGIGAYVLYRPAQSVPVVDATPAAPPANLVPAGPAAPAAAPVESTDCVVPGPAPALPRAEVATADDMRIQHDAIQAFVTALQNYQQCYQHKIDTAPPDTDNRLKQRWVNEGNHALEIANKIAQAYAAQIEIYKAHHPQPAAK
jgi:hypothetical protein